MTTSTIPATAVLAIDAGQTGIKVRFVAAGAPDAAPVAPAAPVERVFDGVRTDAPILPQLAAVIRAFAAETPLGEGPVITAGVSGLTSAEYDAGALRALVAEFAPARVLLTHDSVTSYLGTLGAGHGAVIASGTGVVTLAVGPAGVARVDGWGYIMGDAGSGYWFGQQALGAVMRAHDRRGPATALTAVVRERWPDLEDAYVQLQSDPARVSVVASYARTVAELADTDEVAARICAEGADELALSTVAALRRVELAEAPVVSAIGGVFGSSRVRAAFEDAVTAVFPDVRFEAPHGTGLDGAVELAALAADHPLLSLIAAV